MTVKAILTDIEGTTSSIAFVHDTLFPYAARVLPDYLRQHAEEHEDVIAGVREEAGEPEANLERVISILLEWIAADRKGTPLKNVQGHIWTRGYESGAFTGHVYDDAVEGLHRWHDRGIALYVYSSGSIKAQKLLFGYSDVGDLTPLFSGYFDTTTGHKREADSYRAIAEAIGTAPGEILFLSDVAEELDAAAEVGMQTCQLVRDGKVIVGTHPTADSFDAVTVEGQRT